MEEKNITWSEGDIKKEHRQQLLGQKNKVVWFTGLSGSGKSTIAREVEKALHQKGKLCYVLDGDNVRFGINKDLGFSPEDREENIRRIGEISKLFYDAGVTILACFVSPYVKDREQVRNLIGHDFIEVFVDAPLSVCEQRDTKGLYQKARTGEIKEFTGISAPYEQPPQPTIRLSTDTETIQQCVEKVLGLL